MSRSQRVLVVVIEHPLSWGDEKQRSFLAAPRGLAARLVLEDDALRRQLVADAVGCGEVAALARFVAAGDGVLDRRPGRIVALVALEPNLRILLEEAKEIAGGDERGGMARGFCRAAFAEIDVEIAQMLVHARQGERRVDVVAQRVEDGTRIARPVQRGAAMPDRAEPEIEAVERLLRLRHAFAREFERLAVMAAEQRQADRLARPFGQELLDRNGIAQRLRHLLARRRGEEAVMQPVAGERRAAMGADALRDLVPVVRKDEVEAAAMDVEGLAEMRLGHRRAFDVPARPAAPTPLGLPGAVPP